MGEGLGLNLEGMEISIECGGECCKCCCGGKEEDEEKNSEKIRLTDAHGKNDETETEDERRN